MLVPLGTWATTCPITKVKAGQTSYLLNDWTVWAGAAKLSPTIRLFHTRDSPTHVLPSVWRSTIPYPLKGVTTQKISLNSLTIQRSFPDKIKPPRQKPLPILNRTSCNDLKYGPPSNQKWCLICHNRWKINKSKNNKMYTEPGKFQRKLRNSLIQFWNPLTFPWLSTN